MNIIVIIVDLKFKSMNIIVISFDRCRHVIIRLGSLEQHGLNHHCHLGQETCDCQLQRCLEQQRLDYHYCHLKSTKLSSS